jgi:uncharacterized membrane protein
VIAAAFDEQTASGRIIIRPNRSWTWRANSWFVGTLMVLSGIIATGFTLQGLYLVLPFTVLEMSVLTGCLYYCVRRTHTTEVLSLTRNEVVYERGIRRPTERHEMNRFYSRFLVEPPRHRWYGRRIELKCRERALEIGRFLTEDDKDHLIAELRTMIRRLDQLPAAG